MKKSFGFVLLSLSLLAGCYVNPSLLLVGLPDAPKSAQFVADGEGENARFGFINSLEIDSQGNLYVLDDGPERLSGNLQSFYTSTAVRKITPGGKVTTLLGRGTGQTLVGTIRMAIRKDILYVTSAGCFLKADLKQETISFQSFYGTCLSLEEVQSLQEQWKGKDVSVPIETYFWNASIEPIQPEKNLYIGLGAIKEKGGSLYLKITPDEKIIPEPERRYFPAPGLYGNFVINSKDMIFGYTVGAPGPGPAGKNSLYQVPFQDTFKSTFDKTPIYQDKLTSPGALAVDNKDYLYVVDSDELIKRFSPQGEMVVIGKVQGAQGPIYGPIADQIINPQRTWFYFASPTAIYKIPLPPPSDS